MTDDTMAAAVKAAAEAVSATGVMGCGCCATYPPERCACGNTAADLGYDVCPACDRWPETDYDRDRIVAEAAVTAAAPHLLAPVEAEVQRLSEAFIASEAEVARLRNPDLRIVMGYDLGREEGERERDEAVAAALALHQPEGYFTPDGLADDCPTCDVLHPCATYRALTDAGDDATGTGEAS